MKESHYKSYDDLPLFLNAKTVAKVLGVSPSASRSRSNVCAFSLSADPAAFLPGLEIFSISIPFRSLTDNIWMDQTQELIHGVGLSGILHFWYICPGSF